MPKFHSVTVTNARAPLSLKTNFIIVSNRGDEQTPPTGDIELSLETSDDTFLLRVGERQEFWGDFTHLCFKRVEDGHTEKVRVDVYEA